MLKVIQMKQDKKVVCMQEIGRNESCLVIEDLITRDIRFLRIQKCSEFEMQIVGLGQYNSAAENLSQSKVLKFRSSARYDQETGKWYHVGVLLRENGRLEFYSDFIYTDMCHNENKKCVDIESGDTNFYFKFKPQGAPLGEYHYSKARQTWKNRLGPTTLKPMKLSEVDSWDQLMHRRFSNYVKLFSDMAIFSTYLVVAHRNLISLYCMGSLNAWIDTIEALEGSSDHVRKLQIKKRPRKDRP